MYYYEEFLIGKRQVERLGSNGTFGYTKDYDGGYTKKRNPSFLNLFKFQAKNETHVL